MADDEFVKTHFGKYPVIKVSFLCCGLIISKDDVVNVFREAIHEAYDKHRYLYECTDSELEQYERDECRRWCEDYHRCSELDVMDGLRELSEYLTKFFNRRVFVLIDEFDSVVSSAIDTTHDKENLRKIIVIAIGVIGRVVKDNGTNLAGVLITGIFDLHGIGFSTLLGNVARDTFAEEKPRMKYYGFNLEEVEKLFEIFSVDEGLRKKAIAKYNSYYTKSGEHGIFNPYAIVQFLSNHRRGDASLENYWQASGYVQSFENLFRKDNVKEMIRCMLQGRQFPVVLLHQLNLDNLEKLRIANRDSRATISTDLVCLFLLRQGYLTYIPKRESLLTVVGIPDDLRPIFMGIMVQHLRVHCGLNDIAHKSCQNLLNSVMNFANKDKAVFTSALKPFTDKLGELIQTTSIAPCNEAGIKTVVSSVVLTAGYTCVNQVYNVDQKRLDVIAHKDGQGIIIELKYIKGSSHDALVQLLTQGYYKEFINEKHYDDDIKLRLAMGLHFTEKREGSTVKATVHCLRDVEINEVLQEMKIKKDETETEIVPEIRIAMACANEATTNSFVAKAISVT